MKNYSRVTPSRLFLYGCFTVAFLLLRCVGNNAEPFSLALAFAVCTSSFSPIVTAVAYFFTSAFFVRDIELLVCLGQAVLLACSFSIERNVEKTHKKHAWLISSFALIFALGLFVAFSPFEPYILPFATDVSVPIYWQKTCIAACILLLASVYSVAIKALLYKILKCRLRGDEMIFCIVLFVLLGVAICKLLGVNAYMGIALLLLLTFAYVTKDATALVAAFVLALPSTLVFQSVIERFFIYGAVIALLVKAGRLCMVLGYLGVFFAYAYIDGAYAYAAWDLVQTVLVAVLPALCFILLPAPVLRQMETKLIFYREKHLSRIAINRNRAAVGEQLFEVASVFQEIQATFSALGTTEAEDSAKEYIKGRILLETCKTCSGYAVCKKKGAFADFALLVDMGCQKGKVNLMDIPNRLAEACINPSGVLYALNRQIGEYRKYMAEMENAANGRALLAGQAQGVSEILKNIAVEQSEPMKMYTEKEHALTTALLRVGIVCSEVLIYGEDDNLTVSLVTFGKSDVKKIAAVAQTLFGVPMMMAQRIVLTNDKFCCILRRKPHFDAAFGVSSMKKSGESASGDTHTVVKIDEKTFLVALSDGMGSGEYAKRVSECTISLLESFYRAKMPSPLVLSAVNTLLSFSKEETFACVDIAVIDLANGRADIVKIGSPVGFILSGNTIKVLDSGSLPLGILDSLKPEAASYTLQENDVLLFLSDGITGAFGSTADLYDVLKNAPISNPQQLADYILERALVAYGGQAKDDMTALAVRLFRGC